MNPFNENASTSQPTSDVWPPPPVTEATPETAVAMVAPIERFRVQNVWLVLLLSLVTLGIYPVFWLRRQLAVIRSYRHDLVSSLVFAYVTLSGIVLTLGLAFASGATNSSALNTASDVVGRIFGIMFLVLSFQMRNATNMMIQAERGDKYWFSGIWTWLFGVVYLQYKINKNIQRWQTDPRNPLRRPA